MHHTVGSLGTPCSSRSTLSSAFFPLLVLFTSCHCHHFLFSTTPSPNKYSTQYRNRLHIHPLVLLYQLLIISTTPVHAFCTCIYFEIPTFLLLSPVSFLSLDLGMYLPIYTPDYSDGESTSQSVYHTHMEYILCDLYGFRVSGSSCHCISFSSAFSTKLMLRLQLLMHIHRCEAQNPSRSWLLTPSTQQEPHSPASGRVVSWSIWQRHKEEQRPWVYRSCAPVSHSSLLTPGKGWKSPCLCCLPCAVCYLAGWEAVRHYSSVSSESHRPKPTSHKDIKISPASSSRSSTKVRRCPHSYPF